MLAATFYASLLIAVPAPEKRTEPASTSWIGKTVIVANVGISIGNLDANGQLVPPLTQLLGLDYRVYAERDGFIQLKTREGVSGWLSKDNAVRVDDAVAHFTKRLQQNPNDLDAYNRRGWAWKLKGEHDAALKDMAEAIRLSPQSALYNNRALVHIAKKDFDAAIVDYSRAIELNPQYALPYANRAQMWHMKKEYDKALADFDKALQLNANYVYAYRNRGVTWHAKREYDNAIADFERALKIDPKLAAAHADRGNAWLAKGDVAKARSNVDEAIRLDPKYEPAYCFRGKLLDREKEYDQALAAYAEALRLNPRFVRALLDRAATWSRTGAPAKALADLELALRHESKNAEVCAVAALHLASCPDAKLRDGKRALTLALQAHELEKNNVDTLQALAAAHAELGSFGEAVRWQERALEDAQLKGDDLARRRLELYRKMQPYRQ